MIKKLSFIYLCGLSFSICGYITQVKVLYNPSTKQQVIFYGDVHETGAFGDESKKDLIIENNNAIIQKLNKIAITPEIKADLDPAVDTMVLYEGLCQPTNLENTNLIIDDIIDIIKNKIAHNESEAKDREISNLSYLLTITNQLLLQELDTVGEGKSNFVNINNRSWLHTDEANALMFVENLNSKNLDSFGLKDILNDNIEEIVKELPKLPELQKYYLKTFSDLSNYITEIQNFINLNIHERIKYNSEIAKLIVAKSSIAELMGATIGCMDACTMVNILTSKMKKMIVISGFAHSEIVSDGLKEHAGFIELYSSGATLENIKEHSEKVENHLEILPLIDNSDLDFIDNDIQTVLTTKSISQLAI